MIYNSLILSRLHYGNALWGKSPGNLIKIQKKAIRALTGSETNAHSAPHLKSLKLLSLTDIYTTKLLCLYKQLLDHKLPKPISNLFIKNSQSISKPEPPRIKTFENTIRFELPDLLLNIDAQLLNLAKTEGTYQTFKTNTKKHIIEQYSSLCTKNGCRACYLPI